MARVFVAALAVGLVATIASAQINPIGEFVGDAQEQFDCRVVFTACVVTGGPCPTMFDSATNDLCTPGAAGCHTTSGWSFKCVIYPKASSMFFGSAGGWAQYTFDPPVTRFGGWFGTNAADPGENNDPEIRFWDKDGNLLGTDVQKVGEPFCDWYWNGWESTGAPIAAVDVEGKLFGGAFIDMDEMQISLGPAVPCEKIKKLKLKCKNNKLKAIVKSSMDEGIQMTIDDNGEQTVITTNKKGKAKMKKKGQTGIHKVFIVECPDIKGEVDCG